MFEVTRLIVEKECRTNADLPLERFLRRKFVRIERYEVVARGGQQVSLFAGVVALEVGVGGFAAPQAEDRKDGKGDQDAKNAKNVKKDKPAAKAD